MEKERKEKIKKLKLQIANIIAKKEREIERIKMQNKQAEIVLKSLFEDDLEENK